MTRAVFLVGFILAIATTSSTVQAGLTDELPSVMVISKSSNRNEVHYAIHVDASCAPMTSAPIRAYWRMRERGRDATEPLSARERGVLGVASQDVSASAVRFALAGLPARAFVVRTSRARDGSCTSSVETTIAGMPTRLERIYVKERLFGVDYVLMTGRTTDGRLVDERVRP